MKIHYLFFLLSFFLITSCNHKSSSKLSGDELPVIKTEKNQSQNDFFTNVGIVPLETNDSCLIDLIRRIEVCDSLLFVFDSLEKLHVFNNKGKYITEIGSKGNGPAEYLLLSSFFLDKTEKTVSIMDDYSGRIITYDFQGNYLSSIKLPIESFRRCVQAVQVDEQKLLINNFLNMEENRAYTLLDLNDAENYEKLFPYDPIRLDNYLYAFSQHAISYMDKQNIHFIMPLCDTIYTYSDNEIYAKYRIETPSEMAPKELFEKEEGSYPTRIFGLGRKGYFTGYTGIFETKDKFLLNYLESGMVLGYFLVDKKNLTGNYGFYSFNKNAEKIPLFRIVSTYDDLFIGVAEAESLIESLNKSESTSAEILHVKEMLQGLEIEDNPVLFYYRAN